MQYILFLCTLVLVIGAIATETTTAGGKREIAIFGGGCFWCMEPPFEQLEGVVEVMAGYCGGDEHNPTYEQVSAGETSHIEAVRVEFDPDRISYRRLLDVYWRQIDPTDDSGQFADRGNHYTTAIFYQNDKQKQVAQASRLALEQSKMFDRPVATRILPAKTFYPAEEYHQDYYLKNVQHYKAYKVGSGRAGFIEKTWDKGPDMNTFTKPDDAQLREQLSDIQFKVTQADGTEPPFKNEYWDNKSEGIYVDVVSGEVLFSSRDKFESGTGWPSFSRPLKAENIVEHTDRTLFMTRTEVRSNQADSHLGHVFEDGPAPTGLRYCINSAALRFVPVEKLEQEGYGEYLELFE